ncbi:TetR/AcrR family transcriptional regulator C-terminal domain-containing protein [Bradyrhizobium canariense]|nr:TetR/AcrR family transcriptional regulator C-terminal domain-containing protein [Bradyrhizobium canariense]
MSQPATPAVRPRRNRSFKHLLAAAPYFQPAHFSATFETGLEILLGGIERSGPRRD